MSYDTWENCWYYDYKVKNAFPELEPNKIYKCISVVEGNVPNNLLRVIINENINQSVYVPESYMTPLENFRESQINQILK